MVGGNTASLNTSSAIGAFDTSSVGTGKTVTVSGLTLTGIPGGIGSYALLEPVITADITSNNNSNTQIANSIIPPPTNNIDNLFFNYFNPPATGVYFYHPLIDINSGPVIEQFQLDYGAYDFIDGEIQKKPL